MSTMATFCQNRRTVDFSSQVAVRLPVKTTLAPLQSQMSAILLRCTGKRKRTNFLAALNKSSSESLRTEVFKGLYGPWSIDSNDVREVFLYRAGLVTTAVALIASGTRAFLPQESAFLPVLEQYSDVLYGIGAGGLGLSLLLIHIYVTPIKRTLQALWAAGIFGSAIVVINFATPAEKGLVNFVLENHWMIWLVGPLFASLTGLVFKEGLCYGKLEAGILVFIIPTLLLGHLVWNSQGWMQLLAYRPCLVACDNKKWRTDMPGSPHEEPQLLDVEMFGHSENLLDDVLDDNMDALALSIASIELPADVFVEPLVTWALHAMLLFFRVKCVQLKQSCMRRKVS